MDASEECETEIPMELKLRLVVKKEIAIYL